MQQLLRKLINLVEVAEPRPPVDPSFISVQSPDLVRAATLFQEAAYLPVVTTSDHGRVRVLHNRAARSKDNSAQAQAGHEDCDCIGFSEAFNDSAQDEHGSAVDEPEESLSPSSWARVIEVATERRAAQKVYLGAIKW